MRPAARPGFALSGNTDLRSAVDAGGDFDLQTAILTYSSLAAAFFAGNGYHGAFATTLIAGGHCDHVEDRRARANFAQAATLRAAHRVGARFGAAATAGWAAF